MAHGTPQYVLVLFVWNDIKCRTSLNRFKLCAQCSSLCFMPLPLDVSHYYIYGGLVAFIAVRTSYEPKLLAGK